jgi:hypothetical protein
MARTENSNETLKLGTEQVQAMKRLRDFEDLSHRHGDHVSPKTPGRKPSYRF